MRIAFATLALPLAVGLPASAADQVEKAPPSGRLQEGQRAGETARFPAGAGPALCRPQDPAGRPVPGLRPRGSAREHDLHAPGRGSATRTSASTTSRLPAARSIMSTSTSTPAIRASRSPMRMWSCGMCPRRTRRGWPQNDGRRADRYSGSAGILAGLAWPRLRSPPRSRSRCRAIRTARMSGSIPLAFASGRVRRSAGSISTLATPIRPRPTIRRTSNAPCASQRTPSRGTRITCCRPRPFGHADGRGCVRLLLRPP